MSRKISWTDRRTAVKQYTPPLLWSGGIISGHITNTVSGYSKFIPSYQFTDIYWLLFILDVYNHWQLTLSLRTGTEDPDQLILRDQPFNLKGEGVTDIYWLLFILDV